MYSFSSSESSFFCFGGKVFGAFLLRLFHLFGLCDDGFDVRVQAAEAFDLHQSIHGLLVGNEAGEGLIVHVHQKYAFPALCQQGGRGASHSKAGEQISLLDVAEAAKAEAKKPKQTRKTTQKQKKPSIRAQLAAAKEEQKKKPPAREKSKEMEV